jgi:hypothetical protein
VYEIRAQTNARGYIDALSDLQRQQLPFAIVVALTRVAWLASAAEKAEMRRIFNQPVPWTIDSIEVMGATKADPTSRIRFKDERVSAGIYLGPQVRGGQRRHTPFEGRLIRNGIMSRNQYAMPVAGADRDGSGNLNPGRIMKILSDLETVDTATAYPGARNRGARNDEVYFATTTGGGRTSHLKPGIYKRQAGQAGILPVFIFTTSRPAYRAIFAFDSVAQRTVDQEFGTTLNQALADAVRNSNHRDKWSR